MKNEDESYCAECTVFELHKAVMFLSPFVCLLAR